MEKYFKMEKIVIIIVATLFIIDIFVIVYFKIKNEKNDTKDFLKSFKRCTDPVVIKFLQRLSNRQATFSIKNKIQKSDLPQYVVEISDKQNKLFDHRLHKTIDGDCFNRVYVFNIGSGKIIIFTEPQKTHNPIVYTKGNFLPEVIQNVVKDYCTKESEYINIEYINKLSLS